MSLEKKLFYGGTFNPVHNGHARLALECIEAVRPSSFTFVPCRNWPSKTHSPMADSHRLGMLEALITEVKSVTLDRVQISVDQQELQREENSYTVETVRQLRADYPEACLVWLVGMDGWVNFNRWHKWREITNYANILVANRPGVELVIAEEQRSWALDKVVPMEQFERSGRIAFIQTTPLQISSTAVRNILLSRHSGKFLLPESVRHYIETHRLYLP